MIAEVVDYSESQTIWDKTSGVIDINGVINDETGMSLCR